GDYAADIKEADAWVNDTLSGKLKTDYRRPPELSTRDNVARAIYTEVKAGRGSEHGGVYLDISYQPADRVRKKLPSMYHQFKDLADVDITKGPMEVGPTMHYTMGGIRVDAESAESKVKGLFAAGECSGGMHGANRLGGNSLSDLIVFGRRAGRGAAAYASNISDFPKVSEAAIKDAIDELEAPLTRTEGANPYQLQKKMHEITSTCFGIFRQESDLKKGLEMMEELKEQIKTVRCGGGKAYNPGWHLCRDLRNLSIAAEAVGRSALSRKESRGAHSRLDFPETDEEQGHENTSVWKDGDKMQLAKTPLPEMPPELKDLLKKKEATHA
ncbi:MAG: FAD-binding protein, partial [Candidatus Obscuribacterales bacterium]|nr:FAD-binding protein [Candidatus Obscuribacterales bacterium]